MADNEKKIDPFDVEALEKSLNDSATRVSTIWVSFLIFGLYLVIAAGGVSHRQIFLEDPVRLPILNIELPLIWFFILAPILFVIVHFYVLIQITLLARTASAYGEAVDHHVRMGSDNARVRQRLANTLFAQMLAGSSREREGVVGWVLKAMAVATLTVAPLAILLTCQLNFLPFHSHWGTWGHRALVTLELVIGILFWLSIRQALSRSLGTWPDIVVKRWKSCLVIFALAAALVILYGALLTFPGEWHASWMRWYVKLPDAERSLMGFCDERNIISLVYSANFDRLSLPREDFVDDERLAKIENATREKRLQPYEGERTRRLRGRDLRCGDFSGVDLRRADMTGIDARGARFNDAELQGTTFEGANLEGAIFGSARLQNAYFKDVKASGADFRFARLQSAWFSGAQLQGVILGFAGLQYSLFVEAQLQGASLTEADLHAASFVRTNLQGADLSKGRLQGATFLMSDLQAANLTNAQLATTSFEDSTLSLARFSKSYFWRAGAARCQDAQIIDPQFSSIIAVVNELEGTREIREGDIEGIDQFIERALFNIPQNEQADFKKELRDKLVGNQRTQEATASESVWRDCASKALPQEEYERRLANFLGILACTPKTFSRRCLNRSIP